MIPSLVALVVVVVVAAVVVTPLVSHNRRSVTAGGRPEAQRGALRQLRDLDDDLAAGKVSEQDHQRIRQALEREALAALARQMPGKRSSAGASAGGPAQRAVSGGRQRWLRIAVAATTVVVVAVGTGLALHGSISPRGAGQTVSGADPGGSEASAPTQSGAEAPGAASAPALTAVQVDAVNAAVAKVKANPKSVPAHLELARAYSAANQLQLSTVEYLAVAQLEPDNAEANTGLALAAFVAGQPQEAKKMADKVLSAAPGYPEALYARGLIQLMGLKQTAAAETDLKSYLAAAPYGAHRSTVETLLAMIPDKAGK